MLPAEIMAKIMSYLDQRDLLSMRLVSRRFSSLAHMQDLQLDWRVASEDASASLSLFAMRHCMGSGDSAPKLGITIHRQRSAFCWPSLILALNCSRLTAIHCESWLLTLLQSQFLMRAAPSHLTSLGLKTSPLILEDLNWQRLSMLTHPVQHLNLQPANAPSMPAWGIAKLPLKTYSHVADYSEGCQVFAAGFRLPPVEVLMLYGDPFIGTEPAVAVSKLQQVHLCGPSRQMIMKYMGSNLQHMHLCAAGYLEKVCDLLDTLAWCAKQITCRHLTLEGFCNSFEPSEVDLFAAVITMPRLSALSIKQTQCLHRCEGSGTVVAPNILWTSHANYTGVLKRVTIQIEGTTRLRLPKPSGVGHQMVDLQANGHAVMCVCATCCPGV